MEDGRQYIQWTPRVPKWKLRKLYETDALGIYDQELIDDVGITLYMRCRDILTIQRAQSDRQVRCPRCVRERREVFIERHGGREELLVCPACGWQITWDAYRASRTTAVNSIRVVPCRPLRPLSATMSGRARPGKRCWPSTA